MLDYARMDAQVIAPVLDDAPRVDEVETLAAAVQDATRRRILLALLHDGGARTVDEVAAFTNVHRTVAFTHLERLRALGLLDKRPRRGRRGKPAALYQVRAQVVGLSYPPRRFQLLAALLGGALRSLGPAGAELARVQGRNYGQALVSGHATTLDDAVGALRDAGAVYTVAGDDIATRSCVFREACDEAREVICSLHAGVLEGAVRAAGITASVEPRGAVSSTGCHFALSRAAAKRARRSAARGGAHSSESFLQP